MSGAAQAGGPVADRGVTRVGPGRGAADPVQAVGGVRRTWIKICGCRRPDDALAAARAGADGFGVILAPGFRRTVAVEAAARIRAAAPSGIQAVGVFLGQPAEAVAAAAAAVGLDALQLHGAGADEVGRRLRGRYRIIRAWDMVGPEPEGSDWLHLEPGAARGGGSGQAWDWSRAVLRRPRLPFVLAGGLAPATVAAACAAVHPRGVDVSSGVESEGRKDAEKIARFCDAVRRWERESAGPVHA